MNTLLVLLNINNRATGTRLNNGSDLSDAGLVILAIIVVALGLLMLWANFSGNDKK